MKTALVFVLAATLSGFAAWYRPGDSAHAMGLVSVAGGKARHPVHLPGGRERYTLVVTGTVLPPYSGDARVSVEGKPDLEVEVFGSDPIVDLGVRHRPYFEKDTLTGLEPRDRFTIWVVLRPSETIDNGSYRITLTDTESGRPVLAIPVLVGAGGGGEGGDHHGH